MDETRSGFARFIPIFYRFASMNLLEGRVGPDDQSGDNTARPARNATNISDLLVC